MTFPLNAWYAVGWETDVERKLFARAVCGKPMVFYRRLDGAVVALDDACWHRLLPLSMGRLRGDDVVCGYHGLVFEPGGRCVHMPSQETINPAACIKSYPVIERHRLIWVWPGDPALANVDDVPDLHWLNDDAWAGEQATINVHCNFRLVLDNLMDLTHETFVHAESIGNAAVAETPFTVAHDKDTVTVTRWMLDVEPPPFLREQYRKSGNVDRWQIINYRFPSTIVIDVGVAPANGRAPTGDRSGGINNMVVNTVTPETETSSHYFWSFPRNYRTEDRLLSAIQRQGIATVFRQDEAILQAQQEALAQNPDKEFYNLNIDAGGMWVRRILQARIAEERDGIRGRSPMLAATLV